MVLSSLIILYKPLGNNYPVVEFFLGNGVNNYLVNLIIICLYAVNYVRLSGHYRNLKIEHANYLSTFDLEQIAYTLKIVGIFFVTII
jgi:hypothetical protein